MPIAPLQPAQLHAGKAPDDGPGGRLIAGKQAFQQVWRLQNEGHQ